MQSFELLEKVQQVSPLVHNMTNQVVANHVANGLLALGASPIMAYAEEEVEAIVSQTACLVLNIGTITTPVFKAMLKAGKAANRKGIPIVLDPVGVGASSYRQQIVDQLVNELNICLIRGNAGEIAQLAKVDWKARGVDRGTGDYAVAKMAREVAEAYGCVVAVSGEVDWISDGKRLASVHNGHPLMTRVTGMGCLLSAVCGAFIGSHSAVFDSTIAAHIIYGIAGEKTAKETQGPGSFHTLFIDHLDGLTQNDQQLVRAEVEELI